jgi:hypothetical protein
MASNPDMPLEWLGFWRLPNVSQKPHFGVPGPQASLDETPGNAIGSKKSELRPGASGAVRKLISRAAQL